MRKVLKTAVATSAIAATTVVALRPKTRSAARRLRRDAARRARHLRGAGVGAWYRVSGHRPDPNVSDDILVQRVRSALGPIEKELDLPRIHVLVEDGLVILHGEVAALRRRLAARAHGLAGVGCAQRRVVPPHRIGEGVDAALDRTSRSIDPTLSGADGSPRCRAGCRSVGARCTACGTRGSGHVHRAHPGRRASTTSLAPAGGRPSVRRSAAPPRHDDREVPYGGRGRGGGLHRRSAQRGTGRGRHAGRSSRACVPWCPTKPTTSPPSFHPTCARCGTQESPPDTAAERGQARFSSTGRASCRGGDRRPSNGRRGRPAHRSPQQTERSAQSWQGELRPLCSERPGGVAKPPRR